MAGATDRSCSPVTLCAHVTLGSRVLRAPQTPDTTTYFVAYSLSQTPWACLWLVSQGLGGKILCVRSQESDASSDSHRACPAPSRTRYLTHSRCFICKLNSSRGVQSHRVASALKPTVSSRTLVPSPETGGTRWRLGFLCFSSLQRRLQAQLTSLLRLTGPRGGPWARGGHTLLPRGLQAGHNEGLTLRRNQEANVLYEAEPRPSPGLSSCPLWRALASSLWLESHGTDTLPA